MERQPDVMSRKHRLSYFVRLVLILWTECSALVIAIKK